jgi:hypothetical protein
VDGLCESDRRGEGESEAKQGAFHGGSLARAVALAKCTELKRLNMEKM